MVRFVSYTVCDNHFIEKVVTSCTAFVREFDKVSPWLTVQSCRCVSLMVRRRSVRRQMTTVISALPISSWSIYEELILTYYKVTACIFVPFYPTEERLLKYSKMNAGYHATLDHSTSSQPAPAPSTGETDQWRAYTLVMYCAVLYMTSSCLSLQQT